MKKYIIKSRWHFSGDLIILPSPYWYIKELRWYKLFWKIKIPYYVEYENPERLGCIKTFDSEDSAKWYIKNKLR